MLLHLKPHALNMTVSTLKITENYQSIPFAFGNNKIANFCTDPFPLKNQIK